MPPRNRWDTPEAVRFDRENPEPQESKDDYKHHRAQRYPGLAEDRLTEAGWTAREAYKRRQTQCDEARGHYTSAKNLEIATVQDKDSVQKMYYEAHSNNILPRGHRRLVRLAGNVGEAEFKSVRPTFNIQYK